MWSNAEIICNVAWIFKALSSLRSFLILVVAVQYSARSTPPLRCSVFFCRGHKKQIESKVNRFPLPVLVYLSIISLPDTFSIIALQWGSDSAQNWPSLSSGLAAVKCSKSTLWGQGASGGCGKGSIGQNDSGVHLWKRISCGKYMLHGFLSLFLPCLEIGVY